MITLKRFIKLLVITSRLIPNTQTYRLTESNPLGPRPLGPRHFCFHPQKNDFVYFSNEQGSSVSVAQINQKTGTLTYLQHISTLPENYTQENTCSQIHITSNGKFLFAPNRGHNSIASFSIDPNSLLRSNSLGVSNWVRLIIGLPFLVRLI